MKNINININNGQCLLTFKVYRGLNVWYLIWIIINYEGLSFFRVLVLQLYPFIAATCWLVMVVVGRGVIM